MFFKSKTEMFLKAFIFNLILSFIKFVHAPYFLTDAYRKYILVEKQMSIVTYKYRFHRRSEKFLNFRSSQL